jgi:hypothetical protein
MKAEIESIKIRIGDECLSLTLETAKSLRDELNKLFPEPILHYMPINPWYLNSDLVWRLYGNTVTSNTLELKKENQ